MESRPDRSLSNGASPERQLPPGGSNIERITEHTRGLIEDVKTWVELRIELAKIEVRERVEARGNDIALKVIMGVLGALAGLMALFMLSFFFAWLWSFTGMGVLPATMLGFLTMTVILTLLAVVVNAAQPQLVDLNKKAQLDERKVKRGSSVLGDRAAAERRA